MERIVSFPNKFISGHEFRYQLSVGEVPRATTGSSLTTFRKFSWHPPAACMHGSTYRNILASSLIEPQLDPTQDTDKQDTQPPLTYQLTNSKQDSSARIKEFASIRFDYFSHCWPCVICFVLFTLASLPAGKRRAPPVIHADMRASAPLGHVPEPGRQNPALRSCPYVRNSCEMNDILPKKKYKTAQHQRTQVYEALGCS